MLPQPFCLLRHLRGKNSLSLLEIRRCGVLLRDGGGDWELGFCRWAWVQIPTLMFFLLCDQKVIQFLSILLSLSVKRDKDSPYFFEKEVIRIN